MNTSSKGGRTPTLLATAALVVALAGTGGPVVASAFDARNADKVDGRHAVGAGATVTQRAGRLVATGSTGRLPNNIIGKPPNADRVDGLDSTELQVPAFVPEGRTLTGFWGFDVQTQGDGDWGTTISFPFPVPDPPAARYVNVQAPPTEECPGTATDPRAAPGFLCIYRQAGGGAALTDPGMVVSRWGAAFQFGDNGSAGDLFAYGTWAVTAPPLK